MVAASPLPPNPYRIRADAVADEHQRQADVAAAVSELAAWVRSDGLDVPPDPLRHLADEPFGLRLDLGHIAHCPWKRVFVSHRPTSWAAHVTWSGEASQGAVYLPPSVGWPVHAVLGRLLERLHGDEVELAWSLAARRPILPRGTFVHPSAWWAGWRHRPLDPDDPSSGSNGELYRRLIHPAVHGSLEAFGGMSGRRIADLGAGDGELAASILARWPDCDVLAVERNPGEVQSCRERLAGRARVLENDARDPSWYAGESPFDAVLLVGLVAGGVMTAEDGAIVVRHAHRALRPGGVCVVAGYSPCLLDASAFRGLGFDVANCVVPPRTDQRAGHQHYVLLRRVTPSE